MQEDLDEDEYQTFYFTYLGLQRSLGHPTLTIHLTASAQVLRQRVIRRGRILEQTSHSLGYLDRLRKSFNAVAREIEPEATVVELDTSDMSLRHVAAVAAERIRGLDLQDAKHV